MDAKQGLGAVETAVREADDGEEFRALIARADTPAVLRRAVTDWALVRSAGSGPEAVAAYLSERDNGTPVYTVVGQPGIGGQFGYRKDFQGLNFEARQTPVSAVLPHFPTANSRGISIAIQAAPAAEILRDWRADHPCGFVPDGVAPTMWISTPGRVAPHSDIHDNVACVAVGRRRFTLFPPEQLENLYLGPLLDAPGGVPVSSVDAWAPDLERHPGFADALASAQACTLEPGDAVFIPALWWHAVESLDALNILVNYWWGGTDTHGLSPYDALSHAALAISQLPAEKRRHWQHYFNALVFRLDGDPAAHLPDQLADLIGKPDPHQAAMLAARLSAALREIEENLGKKQGKS